MSFDIPSFQVQKRSSSEFQRSLLLSGQTPLSQRSKNQNLMYNSTYSPTLMIPFSLLNSLSTIPRFWYAMISILECFISYPSVPTLFSFSFFLLLSLSLHLYEYLSILHQYHKRNNKKYFVWSDKRFQERLSKDINSGDVILLTENQDAPADLLLLASGAPYKNCHVDCSKVTGELSLIKKNTVRDVQSSIDRLDVNEASFYLNLLEATVWFSEPDQNFTSFTGKIKVKGSPRASEISHLNMIWGGSLVKRTPWIFGMAVYVGAESKLRMIGDNSRFKVSKIDKQLDKVFFWIIISILLVSGIHTIIACLLTKCSSPRIFFEFLINYHYAVPFPILFVRIIGRLLLALRLKHESGAKTSKTQIIESLAEVDYILVEKNKNLTTNNLIVHTCVINDKTYLIDKEYHKFHIKEGELFQTEQDFQKIQRGIQENDEKIVAFFMCLLFCNSSFIIDSDSRNFKPEDKTIFAFAEKLGVKVVYNDHLKAAVRIENQEKNFEISFLHESTIFRLRTQVLTASQDEEKFVFYVKGPAEEMIEYLNEDQINYLSEIRHSIPGVQVQLALKRDLTAKEHLEIQNSIREALCCEINYEGRLEAIFHQIEETCEFLGMIVLEDNINKLNKSTIKSFLDSGIKVWITSGDSEYNTFGAAVSSEIIHHSSDIVRIGGVESTEELSQLLKTILDTKIFQVQGVKTFKDTNDDFLGIKDYKSVSPFKSLRNSQLLRRNLSLNPLISHISNIQNQAFDFDREYSVEEVDITVVISGDLIELAYHSIETLKLLTLILFVSRSVIAYDMLTNQKALLAQVLRKNFSNKPAFMAVGMTCDIGMINEASIGVSKRVGDFEVENFSTIKDLIFRFGFYSYILLIEYISVCLYFNTSLVLLLAYLFYFSGFSSYSFIDPTQLWMLGLVQQVCLLIPRYIDRLVNRYQGAKHFKVAKMNQKRLKTILNFIGFGAVSSTISLLFLYCTFFNSISEEGKNVDSEVLAEFIYLHFSLVLFGIGFVEFGVFSLISLGCYFLMSGSILVFILIKNFSEDSKNYLVLSNLFHVPGLVLSLFFSSLAVVAFYYFVKSKHLLVTKEKTIDENGIVETRYFPDVSPKMVSLKKVFKESDISRYSLNEDNIRIIPFSLKFNSRSKENSFVSETSSMNKLTYQIYISIYSVSHLIIFIYSSIHGSNESWVKILLWTSSSVLFLYLIIQFTPLFSKNIPLMMNIFFIISNLLTLLVITLLSNTFSTLFSIFLLTQILTLSNNWLYSLFLAFVHLTLDIYFKSFLFNSNLAFKLSYYTLTITCLASSCMSISYFLELNRRKEYLLISEVSSKMMKLDNIVSLLLPNFVKKHVISGTRYISIDQGIVSVLFCNICDFEEIFEDFSPFELACFLDDLFQKFDKLCEVVGVTKIETVGKTYMACAGLKDSDSDLDPNLGKVSHATRVIELAYAMINIVKKLRAKNRKVDVKIGINSGRVQAGVVGNHKPQFSLVGDTVNTASRMCSTLEEPNKIQITESTFELAKKTPGFSFVESSVMAKGKGKMKTFILDTPNTFATFGLEVAPNVDLKAGFAFNSLNEFIQSTISGQQSVKTTPSGKAKKNTYAHIEYQESLMFTSKSSDFVEKNRFFKPSLKETLKEKQFREKNSEISFCLLMAGLVLALVYYFLQSIIRIVETFHNQDLLSSVFLWHSLVQVLSLACMLLKFKTHLKDYWFGWVLTFLYASPIFFLILSHKYSSIDETIFSLEVSFHALLFSHFSPLLHSQVSLVSLIYFSTWLILVILEFRSPCSILALLFIMICQVMLYHKEIRIRLSSNLITTARKESHNIEKLLAHMVPSHAYHNLILENFVFDKLTQVTIIYADIVGFTAWSSDKLPAEVVEMLSEMFTSFDNLCLEHNVYKVHTIGDCYVAMSNNSASFRDPGLECLSIINFALAMKESIEKTNLNHGSSLNMRIGVHTGDIIGGITGRSIVRYDIYGKDSYIANSMESNGIAGEIAVSHSTKTLIESYRPGLFSFTAFKSVTLLNTEVKVFMLSPSN